jgi:hypothetical protein
MGVARTGKGSRVTARIIPFPSARERLRRRQEQAVAATWALVWLCWWPAAWFEAWAAWDRAEGERIRQRAIGRR